MSSLLLAVAVAHCSGNDAKEVTAQLETVSSWTATLQLIAESWLDNRVPVSFVSRSTDEAARRLKTAEQALEKLEGVPRALQTEARLGVRHAREAARALSIAAAARDTLQARAYAHQLDILGARMEALKKRAQALQ